jgi:hypothetical protein
MRQSEWEASTDVGAMLRFIVPHLSDRKLRLFSAACSRRVLHMVEDADVCKAVEVCESFGDGLVTLQQLDAAHVQARSVYDEWDEIYRPFAEGYDENSELNIDSMRVGEHVVSMLHSAARFGALVTCRNLHDLGGGWPSPGQQNSDWDFSGFQQRTAIERAIDCLGEIVTCCWQFWIRTTVFRKRLSHRTSRGPS